MTSKRPYLLTNKLLIVKLVLLYQRIHSQNHSQNLFIEKCIKVKNLKC